MDFDSIMTIVLGAVAVFFLIHIAIWTFRQEMYRVDDDELEKEKKDLEI